MPTHSPVPPSLPSHRLRLVPLLLAVAAVLTAVVAGAANAGSAPRPIRPGLGVRVGGGDFVGSYLTNRGVTVYCISPAKATPATITLAAAGRIAGVDARTVNRLSYALTNWGRARTARQAAVESQVLNTLVGNRSAVARRSRHLPAGLAATVAAHVRSARAFAGPYSVRVRTPRALLPGQAGVGSVRVFSSSGHRLHGLTVTLSASRSGSVTRSVHIGSSGVGRFRYTAVDVGEVRITARAVGLPAERILASRPEPWEQLMITARTAVTARGVATFERRPSGFAHRYECSTTCDGRPTTTLSGCAEPSARASRIIWSVGGHTLRVDFGPSGARQCRHVLLRLHDGDQVRAVWRFATTHGWSQRVAAAGRFVVDCPAAPSVAVSLVYDCARASVTLALADRQTATAWTPMVNRTRHNLVLVVDGAVSRRIVAGPGDRAVFTATVDCSSPVTYTVRGAVQRADGTLNLGPRASVTTPGPAAGT